MIFSTSIKDYDFCDFYLWLPFRSSDHSMKILDDSQVEITLTSDDFTYLDVVRWYIDEFTMNKPVKIDFLYGYDYQDITVFFENFFVTFTFFTEYE